MKSDLKKLNKKLYKKYGVSNDKELIFKMHENVIKDISKYLDSIEQEEINKIYVYDLFKFDDNVVQSYLKNIELGKISRLDNLESFEVDIVKIYIVELENGVKHLVAVLEPLDYLLQKQLIRTFEISIDITLSEEMLVYQC